MATSLIQILVWVTTNVGNYTLALNATKLSGDIFINFALAAAADIPPAFLMYFTLQWFDRRANVGAAVILLGAACLVLAALPKSWTTAILVVYLIGMKYSNSVNFLVSWSRF